MKRKSLKQLNRKDFFSKYLILTFIFLIFAIAGLFIYTSIIFEKYSVPNEEKSMHDDSLILNDKIFSVWDRGVKDSCNDIDDPYLKYMCLRLRIRPHMSEFMSKNVSYSLLASIAKNTDTGSCLSDECKYYSMLPYFVRLSQDYNKVDYLINECEKIEDSSWRSECYYTIADELTFVSDKSFDGKYKLLAELCSKSTKASDYLCFNHVAMLLSPDEGRRFCAEVSDVIQKEECFFGVGAGIAGDNIDMNIIMSECNKEEQHSFFCFKGAYDYIESKLLTDTVDVAEYTGVCNSFISPFAERCLLKLSHQLVNDENSCREIPLEYQKYCLGDSDDSMSMDCVDNDQELDYDYSTCMAFVSQNLSYCLDQEDRYGFTIPCEGVVFEEGQDLDVFQRLFLGDIENVNACSVYGDLEEKTVCDVSVSGNFDRCEGLVMSSKDMCYMNGRFFNAIYEKEIKKCDLLEDDRMKAYCQMFINPSYDRCDDLKKVSCSYDLIMENAKDNENPKECLATSNYYLALSCLNELGE